MRYIIITLVLLCSLVVKAQNPDNRVNYKDRNNEMRDKIKALAIAHITKALDLSTEEAQRFWPLYNEVKNERAKLEKVKKQLIRKLESEFDNMTEKQASSYVDQMVALDKRIGGTNLDYKHDDIIKVIGAKRFLKLKKAEMDFRRKMIREYRDRKHRK
jgi:polyhydroxyalkanoate synthesis regulator phasin